MKQYANLLNVEHKYYYKSTVFAGMASQCLSIIAYVDTQKKNQQFT